MVAEVLEHGRDKKIVGFKYKAKTRYRRNWGHRQGYTRLSIRRIVTGPEEATEETVSEEAMSEPETKAKRTRRATRVEASLETPGTEARATEPTTEAKTARRTRAKKVAASDAPEEASEKMESD